MSGSAWARYSKMFSECTFGLSNGDWIPGKWVSHDEHGVCIQRASPAGEYSFIPWSSIIMVNGWRT